MARSEEIADIFLNKGLVTKEQIAKAREESVKTGLSLEKSLQRLGYIKDADIINAAAESMHVLYVDLKDYLIDPEVIKYIPEELAKKHKCVPLFKVGDSLTVAMANPRDIMALDEIRIKSKVPIIEPVLANEKGILQAVEQYYGAGGTFDDLVKGIAKTNISAISGEQGARALAKIVEEAPTVKFVNLIIMEAVKAKASDIHIEPEESMVRVRYRIDGILHEALTPPKNLQSIIISRIKIMSDMDISESRKPQDGRIRMMMDNRSFDLRVSTFPTVHGENIVMRILDKSSVILGLSDLGFSEKDLIIFEKLIKAPYGIILVTGPTGSGKTTTLYSALATINSLKINIITVEDPVEYEIPLIRQTQVNVKAGLTFASALRTILRQDPDVVMVGEIRDKETAEIAIQASLTGHLVFSTLHTNDAASSITRLMDMGVEPFLIASSVIGILAQRLVRVICKKCKEKYTPDASVLKSLVLKESVHFYRGKGCDACKGSGYTGRIGIYEQLVMSEGIKKMINARATLDEIKKLALKEGMKTLRQDGLDKARNGITTLEEVMRVTEEES